MSIPLKNVEYCRYLTKEFLRLAANSSSSESHNYYPQMAVLQQAGRGRGAEYNAGSPQAAMTFDSSDLALAHTR
jgi:hypothetical protein